MSKKIKTSPKKFGGAKKPARLRKVDSPKSGNDSYAAIYEAIRRVPRGQVSNYGAIAHLAGLPGRARLVGTALRNSAPSLRLPWHRIVTSSGRLAFAVGSDPFRTQQTRLQREGVKFSNHKIDMRRFGWPPRDMELDELLWGMR